MWIAWPSFLVAGLLEMLLFALFDPLELHGVAETVELSRTAIYTLTFFALWTATMLSSALTTLLAASPFEVNRCPLPPGGRPSACPKPRGSR